MDIADWEVWDTLSGNLIFSGTPAQVDEFIYNLFKAQGEEGLEHLKVGPENDCRVFDAIDMTSEWE